MGKALTIVPTLEKLELLVRVPSLQMDPHRGRTSKFVSCIQYIQCFMY